MAQQMQLLQQMQAQQQQVSCLGEQLLTLGDQMKPGKGLGFKYLNRSCTSSSIGEMAPPIWGFISSPRDRVLSCFTDPSVRLSQMVPALNIRLALSKTGLVSVP